MKAALYHGPRDIQVEELPMPAIAADEVLVRVVACGISGADLHLYRGRAPSGPRPRPRRLPAPGRSIHDDHAALAGGTQHWEAAQADGPGARHDHGDRADRWREAPGAVPGAKRKRGRGHRLRGCQGSRHQGLRMLKQDNARLVLVAFFERPPTLREIVRQAASPAWTRGMPPGRSSRSSDQSSRADDDA